MALLSLMEELIRAFCPVVVDCIILIIESVLLQIKSFRRRCFPEMGRGKQKIIKYLNYTICKETNR